MPPPTSDLGLEATGHKIVDSGSAGTPWIQCRPVLADLHECLFCSSWGGRWGGGPIMYHQA
ncbi:hypothetical protein [Actinomyces gaoshouyii]|uniref:Uncharacterized protein n=1 Tax=Actinomyces gaoshouyii TaxID=1960083 RepID=A0A8H9LJ32_9ACTO|nr:hypothetical protein [Actinomyces gaoshouyii]GGO97898.1 hypothetical protein GCM10011612_11540 [Actinomyces gaoshouyii]